MWYLDSTPYFFMAVEMIADLANEAISKRYVASAHLLEQAAEARSADDAGAPEAQAETIWGQLPAEQSSAATAKINVYLDDFISVVQRGPKERCQILQHLFHQIDHIFRPNEEADMDRKYTISWKKLEQGDGAWSTRKTVLGWNTDTVAHLLRLPHRRQSKLEAALVAIPRTSHITPLRNW